MKSECQNCCCKSLTNNASRSRHHRHQAAKIVDLRLLKTSRKISAVASFLGVSRKMLSKYTKGENLTRKVRKDKLSKEDIEKVWNFYLQDVSKEKPNKRDVILMKGDNGEKMLVQKHILEVTQQETSCRTYIPCKLAMHSVSWMCEFYRRWRSCNGDRF